MDAEDEDEFKKRHEATSEAESLGLFSHLKLAPLRQQDDVVGRLAAHVQQRLAALAHPHRVRAFRVSARESFPEADVQEPELDPLSGFGPERPATLLAAGVVLRVDGRHQELAARSADDARRRRQQRRRRRQPDVALARTEHRLSGDATKVDVDASGTPVGEKMTLSQIPLMNKDNKTKMS